MHSFLSSVSPLATQVSCHCSFSAFICLGFHLFLTAVSLEMFGVFIHCLWIHHSPFHWQILRQIRCLSEVSHAIRSWKHGQYITLCHSVCPTDTYCAVLWGLDLQVEGDTGVEFSLILCSDCRKFRNFMWRVNVIQKKALFKEYGHFLKLLEMKFCQWNSDLSRSRTAEQALCEDLGCIFPDLCW